MLKTRIIFLLIAIPQIIFAQWKGAAEVGGSYYSGNVNKLDLRSQGSIAHKDSIFEFSSFYKAIYAETDNVQNNEEMSGGVKFDYLPQSRFSPFIVFSAYKNDFKNIHLRLSSILGGKYILYLTEKSNYSMSLAYQYDAEQYVEDATNKNKNRVSLRPKIKQKIGKSIYFEHITFFKPNLQDFNDYIIESSSSISNKLSEKISLKISYDIEYVNKPTKVDLLKTDQALVVSLKFSL